MENNNLIKVDQSKFRHQGSIGLFVPGTMQPIHTQDNEARTNPFPVPKGEPIWFKPQRVTVKVYNECNGVPAIWIEGTFEPAQLAIAMKITKQANEATP